MWRTVAGAALSALLGCGGLSAGEEGAVERPRLDLRATPRLALPPVSIFFVAELRGGDDVEEFYCPELEWDWGDGTRSGHESDCAPFKPGDSVERFFSARHAYRAPGAYEIHFRLHRRGHTVALASVNVLVHEADTLAASE